MKIPQHLLRSFALGLGAVSIAALSGCEPKPEAPMPRTGCWEPVPPPPLPVSTVGDEGVGTGAPSPVEPAPTDPCPPCGRG